MEKSSESAQQTTLFRSLGSVSANIILKTSYSGMNQSPLTRAGALSSAIRLLNLA